MRRYLFVAQGVIPKETIYWKGVSDADVLQPGTRNETIDYIMHT